MPTLTTAFAVKGVHPSAQFYYNIFPAEPIPPAGSTEFLTVTKFVEIDNNQIETLLAAIVEHASKNASILVISHGNERGLQFRFGRDGQVLLEAAALRRLGSYFAGRLSDEEAAKQLLYHTTTDIRDDPTGIKQFTKLKGLRQQVAALELNRVDLRSCKSGKSLDTLRQLQFFFNSTLCCAPDEYDIFGPVRAPVMTRSATAWAEFKKKYPRADYVGVGGENFGIAYLITTDGVVVDSIATSQEAVNNWVAKYLPPGKYNSGQVFYHGLSPVAKQGAIKIVFAGEAAFREHLVAVTDGKGVTTIPARADAPLERER